MSPTGIVRTLITATITVLIVGSIDTGVSGEWDLFTLFVMGLTLSVVLLSRVESRRPAIPIRRDLAVWLRERAAVSGESVTAVTDRAISTFADRYGAVSEVEDTRR